MAAKNKKTVRRSKPKEPREIVETNLNIEGSDNAVATGPKSFAASIKIIFQGNWRPFAIILILVAFLLSLILWYVIPKSEQIMNGLYNVAVAEFQVRDSQGNIIASHDGVTLADYVSQQINTQFADIELQKIVSYEVWSPKQTGIIKGDTVELRAVSAAKRAEKIHAHILIYGVIIADGANSKFLPEFYVNNTNFQDASEITGEHDIGSQLRISLPFNKSIQPIQNPALAGRVNALNLISLGLAYYSIDDFENALQYFQKAAAEPRWIGDGKEVAYLLVGNAYVRQDSKTQEFSDLTLAAEAYQNAWENNNNYGRARIGQANIFYLEASQDKNNCDPSGLDQASNLLDQALDLKDQPPSANIETKVHFYRGQIALIRDACHIEGEDWLTAAQQEFDWVVNQYESRKQNNTDFEGVKPLASHAYARLGVIAYKHNEIDQAVNRLNQSIKIASPYYQGYYTALIGDIYFAEGQKQKAIEAYTNAIAIAQQYADGKSMKSYQEKLQKVESP